MMIYEEMMDSNITKVTDHAYARGKQRLGFSKSTMDRMTKKAFAEGVRVGEMTGSLHSYFVSKLEYPEYENSFFRLYGEAIYVFALGHDIYFGDSHPILVTVMCIPQDLRKQAIAVTRKRRAA